MHVAPLESLRHYIAFSALGLVKHGHYTDRRLIIYQTFVVAPLYLPKIA